MGKSFDPATPDLFFALAQGRAFDEVTLSIVTQNPQTGRPRTSGKYTLRDATLVDFDPGGDRSQQPGEVIAFNFERIEVTRIDDNGSEVSRFWDFNTNTGG